jgi:hypothetical protein
MRMLDTVLILYARVQAARWRGATKLYSLASSKINKKWMRSPAIARAQLMFPNSLVRVQLMPAWPCEEPRSGFTFHRNLNRNFGHRCFIPHPLSRDLPPLGTQTSNSTQSYCTLLLLRCNLHAQSHHLRTVYAICAGN